jgi:MraZ protein
VSQAPYRGGPVLTLDQKGRITVPARWREQLMASVGGRLIVTKNADGGLSLYPPPVWEQLERVVLELTADDDPWRRILAGNSEEVEIDSASRVLIPPDLRRWAGLEREVKFMGLGTYFELWDLGRYEVHEAQAIARGKPEALRNLRLA